MISEHEIENINVKYDSKNTKVTLFSKMKKMYKLIGNIFLEQNIGSEVVSSASRGTSHENMLSQTASCQGQPAVTFRSERRARGDYDDKYKVETIRGDIPIIDDNQWLDCSTKMGGEKFDDLELDFLEDINMEHIPENTFVNCYFRNKIYIYSSVIETNAFVNCIFEEYVILVNENEHRDDVFLKCTFKKGYRKVKFNTENNDIVFVENVECNEVKECVDENIDEYSGFLRQIDKYEVIQYSILQTDVIPSNSFKNKKFINNLDIIANDICVMAFNECIFEENVNLHINTYEGDIFHNCIFKKKINFRSISGRCTPSLSINNTPKDSRKSTPIHSLPQTPPTSVNNSPPQELEISNEKKEENYQGDGLLSRSDPLEDLNAELGESIDMDVQKSVKLSYVDPKIIYEKLYIALHLDPPLADRKVREQGNICGHMSTDIPIVPDRVGAGRL